MIESVIAQSCGAWELLLVDNGCGNADVSRAVRDWSDRDGRIRAVRRSVNGNISAATNEAADAAAGDYLVVLDSDDLLEPDALAHLALYLDAHPETDLVYSDEDQIGPDHRPHSPQFKPNWSPELLLSFCYVGHLAAIRRGLYRELGGMRSDFDGARDHDLWLRAAERTRRVGHVPQVLDHRRIVPGSSAAHGKPATLEAGRRAVEEAFHRRGLACTVEQRKWAAESGCAVFEPVMPDDGPSVAILIPSRNHGARLKLAIDSLTKTTYRNYRIYVIDNESDDPETLRYLATLPHRVLRIDNPAGRFSFAAINNAAAAVVEEELLLFLNDDTEVINARWLSQMVGWSRLEGVGAVGARLLYPDGRIQHAGVAHPFNEGLSGHSFRLLPWWNPGPLNLANVSRNSLAITAACMLTPRKLFAELGGFDQDRFAIAYNDRDYCYRLADAGYRCVYCAEAELYHHEGLSREEGDDPRELAAFREVHGHRIDPYFSPHHDPDDETYRTKPTVVPIGPVSRPIPLLAVTHNLNWEGAPRVEFELVSRLHASGAIRAEVLSPGEGPMGSLYEQAGIPVRVEPELSALGRRGSSRDLYQDETARLARLIVERGYEVVHANTLQTFWAVEAARRAGVPSVWSVHESEPWRECYKELPREVTRSALECLAYPYRVVFTARSSARVWSDFNTAGNFEIIRVARDFAAVRSVLEQTTRSRARQELKLQASDVCVLLLGTVCERKNQLDLLGAFAALPGPVAVRMKCMVVGARHAGIQPQAPGAGGRASGRSPRSFRRDPRDGRDRRLLAGRRRVLLHVAGRELPPGAPGSDGRGPADHHDPRSWHRRAGEARRECALLRARRPQRPRSPSDRARAGRVAAAIARRGRAARPAGPARSRAHVRAVPAHLQGRLRERSPVPGGSERGHRGPRKLRPWPDVVRRFDSRPGGVHEPHPCRRPDRELDSRDGQDARRRVTGWSTAGW